MTALINTLGILLFITGGISAVLGVMLLVILRHFHRISQRKHDIYRFTQSGFHLPIVSMHQDKFDQMCNYIGDLERKLLEKESYFKNEGL